MKRPQWKIKQIQRAQKEVGKEIARNSTGKYGAGLASEGFAGGYTAALSDVMLLLNDAFPCRRPDYWDFMGEG